MAEAWTPQVNERMLALKNNCVHPETKEPYVKSSIGGKDNSPEGYQVRPCAPASRFLMVTHEQ